MIFEPVPAMMRMPRTAAKGAVEGDLFIAYEVQVSSDNGTDLAFGPLANGVDG
jgi:hypothetical protein